MSQFQLKQLKLKVSKLIFWHGKALFPLNIGETYFAQNHCFVKHSQKFQVKS